MKKYLFVMTVVLTMAGCASSTQSVIQIERGSFGNTTQTSQMPSGGQIVAPETVNSNIAPLVASRYRLGKGDVFSINVFNEPDLSKAKIRMSDAGTVQYISLGEVVVEGLSVSELEALITKSLKGSYLTEPKVTVSIDEYRPVFMSGQVAKTGIFPYQPGMTVLRAITIAGGFAPRADEKKLYIQKENNPGQLILVGPNTLVEPGDIISVGESFF